MKRIIAAALCLTLILCGTALADDVLVLPSSTERIDAEAFFGDASFAQLILPDNVVSIGDRAFSGCAGLRTAYIPASVTELGEDVFAGTSAAMLIRTDPGSEAVAYARLHSIDYQADTVYRALTVSCGYSGASALEDTVFDAAHMGEALPAFAGTPWTVTDARNPADLSALRAAVASAFAGATENDVSLFYYSGHGAVDSRGRSCLVLNALVPVTASALKSMLDTVPGRKIVLLDCCYSGGMLVDVQTSDALPGAEGAPVPTASDFIGGMVAPFTVRPRALTGENYFVITACTDSEESWSLGDGGAFTTSFLRGIGYDIYSGLTAALPADTDGDSAVSVQEAYVFARAAANELLALFPDDDGTIVTQDAQCWPSGCGWFAPFRR